VNHGGFLVLHSRVLTSPRNIAKSQAVFDMSIRNITGEVQREF